MRVFFLGSIAISPVHRKTYVQIVLLLKKMGHKVIADQSLVTPNEILKQSKESNKQRGKDLLNKMVNSDCVVFEGTQSTTGGGYYLSVALQRGIPSLFITQEEYKGLYLAAYNRLLRIKRYAPDDLAGLRIIFGDFFKFANKKRLNNRFNLMISDSMNDFLNKFSRENGLSKADLIRDLLYERMEDDKKPKT